MWALDRGGSDQKTMSTCSTVYGRRGGKVDIVIHLNPARLELPTT
jgi:hypothetical protein